MTRFGGHAPTIENQEEARVGSKVRRRAQSWFQRASTGTLDLRRRAVDKDVLVSRGPDVVAALAEVFESNAPREDPLLRALTAMEMETSIPAFLAEQ
jgi:hypothetical protein